MNSGSLRFTIAVPAYNEEKSILQLLGQVKKYTSHRDDVEILVINDGSKDQTKQILESNSDLYSRLISHERNQGKGAAIISALREARGEFMLVQDADLEYSPVDYHKFFDFADSMDVSIVIGSRLSAPSITRVHYFWHKVGNKFITLFFNLIHNTTYTDIYCGYLMIRRANLNPDLLKFRSWGQQAEILSFLSDKETGIYEVPVSYFGRSYTEGKKIRAKDTFLVLVATVYTKLRSARLK